MFPCIGSKLDSLSVGRGRRKKLDGSRLTPSGHSLICYSLSLCTTHSGHRRSQSDLTVPWAGEVLAFDSSRGRALRKKLEPSDILANGQAGRGGDAAAAAISQSALMLEETASCVCGPECTGDL